MYINILTYEKRKCLDWGCLGNVETDVVNAR